MVVPLRCNAFQKNDVMHMFMETRCLCSCSRFLWCMSAWLGYPQNEIAIERTITSWGVCVASRILTTKIPSALLVAIMWLQRTWRPRFRHGTFSYGITTSPNTKDRVGDIGNTPCVCTLVHPRFPMHMLCKCMLKKRHNYLFIYLFFKRLWERPRGISSWFQHV
jgi:hypothetical protein